MTNTASLELSEEMEKTMTTNSLWESLLKEIEPIKETEVKLQKVIECMRLSLSQVGSPNFRCFWEARKLCLDLFKEPISPAIRSILWAQYIELSQEAYRLKEILDEQSAFAMEQIDIAISGIEKGVETISEQIETADISLNDECASLRRNLTTYQNIQKELNILNAQASQVNALRKELIRTQMRIKQKNKFFKRLSSIGDKIFPRRKELIKTVSDLFIADIEAFNKQYFTGEYVEGSLFSLREEIKGLQNGAKLLTLNSHAFAQSRTMLSACWDKLKGEEKERKKEKLAYYEEFKKNMEEILVPIKALAEEIKTEAISHPEAEKKIDALLRLMKDTKLGPDEVRTLKLELSIASAPIQERKKEEEEKRREAEREIERKKLEVLENIKQKIETLKANNGDPKALINEVEVLESEINETSLRDHDKKKFLKMLTPIRDGAIEKIEEQVLEGSADTRDTLNQLRQVLEQRKERRFKVKEQLDTLRKASGSSGLDFEKSLKLNEQIAIEKERLEKMDAGIEEINGKITALKKEIHGR